MKTAPQRRWRICCSDEGVGFVVGIDIQRQMRQTRTACSTMLRNQTETCEPGNVIQTTVCTIQH